MWGDGGHHFQFLGAAEWARALRQNVEQPLDLVDVRARRRWVVLVAGALAILTDRCWIRRCLRLLFATATVCHHTIMHDYTHPWLNFRADFLQNKEGVRAPPPRRVHANENGGFRADLVGIFSYVDACIARRDHCRANQL